MLFTAVLGVMLNILIAWILAGGGWKLFKEIIVGVFCGVGNSKESDEDDKKIKKKPTQSELRDLNKSPKESNFKSNTLKPQNKKYLEDIPENTPVKKTMTESDNNTMTNSDINLEYYNNNLYIVDDIKDSNALPKRNLSDTNKMNGIDKKFIDSENEEDNKIIISQQKFNNNQRDEEEEDSGEHSSSSFFENSQEEEEDKKDFNLKTTIAHLQGDLAYSIGVLISAVIINIFPNLRFFDSVCTFLFSYVALELTVPIFKEATTLLMEGVHEGKLKKDKIYN